MNPHGYQPPQLLIDGYIATTFGPRDTELYHSVLLRRECRLLQSYNLTEYPGIFFAMPPLRPDFDSRQQQTPWVIDYTVRNQGTVIKQQIYVPRSQNEFLSPPIFFVHRNGVLGVPLNRAAGGDCLSLQGASDPARLGATCSTHAQIRINWHGYLPWDDQIMIRTQGPAQEIIRLEKFVKHVAKKVQKFMTEGRRPCNNGDHRWSIGAGGITPADIVLIGAVHVSQGSWMPILQVNRFIL
ncbi:hypothetical protein BJY52DRAFT_725412 [Lactarius psammicola]|nr:hypothetical protein BJY52DRAFT_725412 [Lactarius psammicola]